MRRFFWIIACTASAVSACDKTAPPIAEEPAASAASASPIAQPSPIEAPTLDPGATARDAPRTPIVRETQEVLVGGVKEQWRIEWVGLPTHACFDDQWSTCPCYGFAFGEEGNFDLVRERPNAAEERLHFSGTLQRWPVLDADRQRWIDGNVDVDEIMRRPEVKLIHLGDYDHDGRATELVLQIGAGSPCIRTWSEIVGVDRLSGKLHAFGTAAHPEKGLVLEYRSDWDAVKKSPVAEVTAIGCGDHGSSVLVTDLVRATPRGFDVERRTYDCVSVRDSSVHRGKLIEKRPWTPEDAFPF